MNRKQVQSLTILLIGLAVITVYSPYHPRPQYELQTVTTPAGWGYQIVSDGKTVIDQPTVPGRAGQRGFSSEQLARRVGECVVSKLRRGQFPPTLTPSELAQLGVLVH
ncbi:DUF4907 domain-containing protein [Larkinella insperata]|uniref:DUF4907 domain-containing protein n=1 Tax=Larkinella insperata TaxID=332158 RepID=A0ABW3Q604_9BACT|nr:DUF4907 domain-containing protein [Larkinella insperata]